MSKPSKPVSQEDIAEADDALQDALSALPEGIEQETVAAVVEVAVEIAREGREGRRVGTLFVIGDVAEVEKRSRCLILDPLEGHPKERRHLGDPNVRETIKELAMLDGGFIVGSDGTVVSAARYFDTSAKGVELLMGLGTRHLAAASITKETRAVAVVVSESSVVRLFHAGKLLAEILPEIWLLRRFSSRIRRARRTEVPRENLAVVSRNQRK